MESQVLNVPKIDNKNDVFICGGQNETPIPFQIYMGSQLANLQDMSGILDTNTWTWRTPKTSYLNQPYPQSNGILSIVNETKLVFGFGKCRKKKALINVLTDNA